MKILAIRILNAKRVPCLIKVIEIYCVYQASKQLTCSQFKHDTPLQLEHIFTLFPTGAVLLRRM